MSPPEGGSRAAPEAPAVEEAPVAAGEPVSFPAGDGQLVAGRWFAPGGGVDGAQTSEGVAWGSVVVAPGVGIPQRFYRRLAAWLAEAGLGVLTFDYRGVGASRPQGSGGRPAALRGRPETLLDWAVYDYAGALAEAAHRLPGRPRFVVGHSFGGQSLGLVPGAERLDAAIIVAASSGDLRHWAPWPRLRFTVQMGLLVPVLTRALGRVPGRLMGGEDLPPGVARQWARWTLTRGYLAGAVPERMGHAALHFPMFVYSPSDDPLGPTAAVDELASWYTGAAITRHTVRPAEVDRKVVGHVGLFKWSGRRVWQRWLADLRAAADGPGR